MKKVLNRKLTLKQLFATPDHMVVWLRSFKPRSVVTRDILDNQNCLGFNFMKAHGYSADIGAFINVPWMQYVINTLPVGVGWDDPKPITAQKALKVIAEWEATQ